MAIKAQREEKKNLRYYLRVCCYELIKYKLVGWQAAIFGIWCSEQPHKFPSPHCDYSLSKQQLCVWKIERKKVLEKKLKKVKNRFSLLWQISAVDDALHVIILTRTSFEVNEVASFLLGAKVPCIRLRSRSIPTLSHGNERGAILFFFLRLIRKSPSPKNGILVLIFFLEVRQRLEKREMPNMEVYFRRRHHLSRVHNAGRSSYFLLFSGDV